MVGPMKLTPAGQFGWMVLLRTLIYVALTKNVPVAYTICPYRPMGEDQSFKSTADLPVQYRDWDVRAVKIDERVAPLDSELVIKKENTSAFCGTHLIGYLKNLRVDTILIAECSTSAYIWATATASKSYRPKSVIVSECVGDRNAAAHVLTPADIQARFADVILLEGILAYLETL